jgi:antitoxin component of MazEF toxin-antitoxin module
MAQRLVQQGNGWALPVGRDLLDLLDATPESEFTVEVKDGALVATPVPAAAAEPTIEEAVRRRAAFEAALGRVNERFGAVLARLGTKA